jgi:hypothetical protein
LTVVFVDGPAVLLGTLPEVAWRRAFETAGLCSGTAGTIRPFFGPVGVGFGALAAAPAAAAAAKFAGGAGVGSLATDLGPEGGVGALEGPAVGTGVLPLLAFFGSADFSMGAACCLFPAGPIGAGFVC